MERPRNHVLKTESETRFRALLPFEWIVRKVTEDDYGIDYEVQPCINGRVLPNLVQVQLKATDDPRQSEANYSINTKFMKFYEHSPIPVVIVRYYSIDGSFHYLFAQEYIESILRKESPSWRDQVTITLYFTPLTDPQVLAKIADTGYVYTFMNAPGLKAGSNGAVYVLDGIPKCDNSELKEAFSVAVKDLQEGHIDEAINRFETINATLVLSPTQRLAIISNLAVGFLEKDDYENISRQLIHAKAIIPRIGKDEALEARSIILSIDAAVKYFSEDLFAALQTYENCLEIDGLIPDKSFKARTLMHIGRIYSILGDNLTSVNNFYNSIELFYEAEDWNGIGHVSLEMCVILAKMAEISIADKFLAIANQIFMGTHDDIGLRLYDERRGVIHHQQENYESAIMFYRECLKKAKSTERIALLGNLAINLVQIGKDEEARKTIEELRTIPDSMKGKFHKYIALQAYASCLFERGKTEDSRRIFDELYTIYNNTNRVYPKFQCQIQIGAILIKEHLYRQSYNHLNSAYSFFLRINNFEGMAYSMLNLAYLFWEIDERNEALSWLNEGLLISHILPHPGLELLYHHNLGRMALNHGHICESIYRLHKCLEISDTLENINAKMRYLFHLGKIYREYRYASLYDCYLDQQNIISQNLNRIEAWNWLTELSEIYPRSYIKSMIKW